MSTKVTVDGLSGQEYTFHTYKIETPFYELPGVYIFLAAGNNGRWDAVYVGETENFNRRLYTELANHDAWQCAANNNATHIGAMVVRGGKDARLVIETDLRHALSPVCNLQ